MDVSILIFSEKKTLVAYIPLFFKTNSSGRWTQGTPLASFSLMRLMPWDDSVVLALDKARLGGGAASLGSWP